MTHGPVQTSRQRGFAMITAIFLLVILGVGVSLAGPARLSLDWALMFGSDQARKGLDFSLGLTF